VEHFRIDEILRILPVINACVALGTSLSTSSSLFMAPLAPRAVALADVLFLLLPLPLMVIANWGDSPPAGGGWPARVAALLGSTTWVLLAVVAATCVLLAFLTLAVVTYALVFLLTGFAAGAILLEPTRILLARITRIDPRSAVHATALVLSIVLVGSQLASQFSGDVLSRQASSGPALGPADLVLNELPFLLAALIGVGLFIRRSPGAALARLGLVRPSTWQIVLALGAAGIFVAFGTGMDLLAHAITPGIAHKVDSANQRLFGQLNDPIGIATIALSAGIAEEALFRGAIQPRLGILWTSFMFAAVHTQYGLSLDAAAVFILAIGLGLLRRFTNTTTSTVCHVVYNTVVGIGLGGVLLVPALAIEAILVALAVTAVFTGRLGRLRTAP
jgi:membrane protease YdiL (CAAX protease family)